MISPDCRVANPLPGGESYNNLWGTILGKDETEEHTFVQIRTVPHHLYAWGDIVKATNAGNLTIVDYASEQEIRDHCDRLKTVIPDPSSPQNDIIVDFAGPIYYVSGHLDLTEDEFQEHYVPQLDEACGLNEDGRFVVGDARGCDAMAQEYLYHRCLQVIVFHMFDAPRNNEYRWPTCGGYTGDTRRDAAMTSFSTHDIAWVRPGRENSGTARNLARRNLSPAELQAQFEAAK